MDLTKLGLGDTPENRIIADAALQWLRDNTTLQFSDEDNLPPLAALFIVKFYEVMRQSAAIKSESIAGMSQSFADDAESVLWGLARTMLLPYLKSNVTVLPGEKRWRYGRYHPN